jgi:hypothetical protein
MFCPRCAVQNLDDAKFCRGCGIGLETVALALSGKNLVGKRGDEDDQPTTWVVKRRKGVNKLVRATGLLGSSLLIGAALGLFGPHDWIVIWMVFCGWMATWGVFSLTSGIQYMIESKYMHKDLGDAVRDTGQLWPRAEPDALPSHVSALPASVTEHTTRTLVEPDISRDRKN